MSRVAHKFGGNAVNSEKEEQHYWREPAKVPVLFGVRDVLLLDFIFADHPLESVSLPHPQSFGNPLLQVVRSQYFLLPVLLLVPFVLHIILQYQRLRETVRTPSPCVWIQPNDSE